MLYQFNIILPNQISFVFLEIFCYFIFCDVFFTISDVFFCACVFILFYFSIRVITSVNLVYAVFSLIFVFIIIILFLFILKKNLIAFLILIIYVGAVLVLFLFVVMVINFYSFKGVFFRVNTFLNLFFLFLVFVLLIEFVAENLNFLSGCFLPGFRRFQQNYVNDFYDLTEYSFINNNGVIDNNFSSCSLYSYLDLKEFICFRRGFIRYKQFYFTESDIYSSLFFDKFYLNSENFFQAQLLNFNLVEEIGFYLYTYYFVVFIFCGIILLVGIVGVLSLLKYFYDTAKKKQSLTDQFIYSFRSNLVRKN